MVRKGGLEPPRPCGRQPLKLVRLPIPPLPQADSIVATTEVVALRWRVATTEVVVPRSQVATTQIVALQTANVYCGGFCAGGGAGAFCCAGAGAARPPTTEPGPRWPRIPSINAPRMNSTAHTVVARESTVAPLRAPNAA